MAGTKSFSQNPADNTDDSGKERKQNKFQVGFFAGSYFANKSSAQLYDGYGFDLEGNKNDFANSIMYRKIVFENSGSFAQADAVSEALNVNHGEWTFDETDMPSGLKYNPAFLFGLSTRLNINKKDVIILNVSAAKLTVTGNFTIVLITSPGGGAQIPGYQNIETFSLSGGEQRVLFQLGYQRITGENENVSLFYEAGANLTMAKFDKCQIYINNLTYDLSPYYTQSIYGTGQPEALSGIGIGGFAGLGLHIRMSRNLMMQLLYAPSLDKINLGVNPKFSLHHSAGFRAYGNF